MYATDTGADVAVPITTSSLVFFFYNCSPIYLYIFFIYLVSLFQSRRLSRGYLCVREMRYTITWLPIILIALLFFIFIISNGIFNFRFDLFIFCFLLFRSFCFWRVEFFSLVHDLLSGSRNVYLFHLYLCV